jgi:hypothetical protein
VSPPLRPLFVPMAEIVDAMDRGPTSPLWYLDTRTGEVSVDPLATGQEVDDGQDGPAPPDDEPQQALIPMLRAQRRFAAMEDFVAALEDPEPARALEQAMKGRGAIGRFEKTLARWPELRTAWHARKQEVLLGQALEWLMTLGIDAQYDLPPIAPPPPRREAGSATPLGLLDVLLLGAGEREPKGDGIGRRLKLPDAGRARRLFEALTRELADLYNVPWRRALIESDSFSAGRCFLMLQDRVILVHVHLPPEILAALGRTPE